MNMEKSPAGDDTTLSPQKKHRPRRSKEVALSQQSHEPWVPPNRWLADPPYLLLDIIYSAAAAAVTILCLFVPYAILQMSYDGASASELLYQLIYVSQIPVLIRVVAACVAGLVFAVLRWLEPVSYSKMLTAEANILSTVTGDVQHHWNKFSTQHAEWRLHSLVMRSAACAAGWNKPTIVFVHGHSAGAAHWEAVLDTLSEVADLYVLDMPGWGRSPCPVELERASTSSRIIDLHCEMLHGWLQANQLKHVTLVGHSFGGFHSIQYASRHPEVVEQLILVSPAGLTPVMPEGALKWGALFRFSPPQWIARVFGRVGFITFKTIYLKLTNEDRRFPDFYYQLAAQTASTGYGDQVAARFLKFGPNGGLWWSQPCLSTVMSLDMPVSVIWGQRDEMLPPVFGAVLHRIRPHTDLYFIKDALHNPAHNNPRAFCDAIADCLLKYRGAPRVTITGRGSGRHHAEGTADALLEPTAHASGARHHLSFSGNVDAPEMIEKCRCLSTFAGMEGPEDSDHESEHSREIDSSSAGSVDSKAHVTTLRGDPHIIANGLANVQRQSRLSSPASSSSRASRDTSTSDQLLSSLPPPPTPSTYARLSRGDSLVGEEALQFATGITAHPPTLSPVIETPAAEQVEDVVPRVQRQQLWQGHDGITSDFGSGRGFCQACYRKVTLHKSYWRCACAAWSFNAHVKNEKTREHFRLLLDFLDELYVAGTFNARSSKTIAMYLRVKTPLPPAHPAPADAPLTPMNGNTQSPRNTEDPMSTEDAARSSAHHRTGQGSDGIIYKPAPETFPRGEAFLLD